MANTQGIAAMVLSGLALLLGIVGTAIPYWIYASVDGAWASQGLWKLCSNVACVTLPEALVLDWLKACRAMEILGILAVAAACLCGILKLFVAKDQKMLPKIAAAAGIAAGVLMLIGAIIFAAKFTDENPGSPYNLHAGFALAIVAGVLAIISGILFVVADNNQQI